MKKVRSSEPVHRVESEVCRRAAHKTRPGVQDYMDPDFFGGGGGGGWVKGDGGFEGAEKTNHINILVCTARESSAFLAATVAKEDYREQG